MENNITQSAINEFYNTCEDFKDYVDKVAKSQEKTVDTVLHEALTRSVYKYYLDDGR